MNRFSAALVLSVILIAPAAGQSIDAPLVFETGQPAPLAGSAPADAALAGDSYLLPFATRNRTNGPIQLRRITLRMPEGLEILDPISDGIDNDRDGIVDNISESFSKTDDGVIAWRIDEDAATIQPGDTLERAVAVKLSDTSRADAQYELVLVAGAATEDSTLRAVHSIPFSLASPTIRATLDGSTDRQILVVSDTPPLRVVMTVPSGAVKEFGLTASASPSVLGYKKPSVVLGEGMTCDVPPFVATQGRTLTMKVGQCRAHQEAPLAERTITLETDLLLSDADPFADPDVIAARRTVRVDASMEQGEQAFGDAVSVMGRIVGPLLGARLLNISEKAVDAGDGFTATYRLVNRGDTSGRGLRLKVADEGAFACRSLVTSETPEPRDGCNDGAALPDIDVGSARDLTVRVKLREDARFDSETALRLSVQNDGQTNLSFPDAAPSLKRPSAPSLSFSSGGEWTTTEGLTTARVGDTGNFVISAELIEGRYDAELRLLSRVVDAQTGHPIAAAPLYIEEFDITPKGDTTFQAAVENISTATNGGWSVAALPLNQLSVPANTDDKPGLDAKVKVSLLDTPELQADRLIELRAELGLLGGEAVRGTDWVEVLIVEPSLDLTVHSPDEDRILDLHDTTDIAILSCNRGKSSADALVLTARLSDMLQPENLDGARVRTIQIERANDNTALFSETARSAGTIHYDDETRILRGVLSTDTVLEPDTCLALVFDVRRTNVPTTKAEGTIFAALEPFTGRDGAQARIYPGLDTAQIMFDLPPILFGPPSEKDATDEGLLAHILSLEIPEFAGAHRVDLSTESSAGLEWTILRLNDDGAPQPWRNGDTVTPGKIVQFRLEALGPETRPLGWTDTTLVRAVAFSDTGSTVSATTRMITRRRAAPGGRIDVTKRMALDRDCDSDLNDERIQDSLFEPVKDAVPGDCVIFHVQFRHTGERSMERIVVRDQVPIGTELREGAIEVLRAPEPSKKTNVTEPGKDSRDVVWTFEGLFEPGAEGEVSYAVKILEQP